MNGEIKNNVDFETFAKIRSKRENIRYQRYIWVVQQEEEYDLRNAILHNVTTQLYQNATLSFIAECDLAAILAIHATIELFIKNVVDPKYKIQGFVRIKVIFDTAENAGWISAKLRQEYIDYGENIRHQVAHTKSAVYSPLGMVYNDDGSWGGETQELIIPGPEYGAKKGIELFLRIVRYYIDSKLSKQK